MQHKTPLKLLLLLITLAAGCQASYAQQNIVRVSTPRTPINNNKQLDNLRHNKDSVESTYQYYDGLGRLIQTVQYQGSPLGYDMVQPVVYDQFGRDSLKYLPYTSFYEGTGAYRPNAVSANNDYTQSDQYLFYKHGKGYVHTPFPYAITNYEASPLNRMVEQGAPGDNWQPLSVPGTANPGHTVKMGYASNDQSTFNSNTVTNNPGSRMALMFSTTINADQSQALSLPLQGAGAYATGELSITISKDENWKPADGCIGTVETYTDKEGHVVLKRTYNLNDSAAEMLSTYYVYDDLGHLAFVIPPLAQADQNGTPDQPTLDNLCYQYRYDERGRMSQKKLPGKGWEYMVYNTLDQVVATQDSLQREQAEWVFTKYDALGRVIMTGLYDDDLKDTTRAGLQSTIDTLSVLWETPVPTSARGYTSVAWPTVPDEEFTVNYYDTYNALLVERAHVKAPPKANLQPTGLLTATQTEVLGDGDMLTSLIYYDDLGRIIETHKQSTQEGTAFINNYDAVYNNYNFTNAVISTVRQHSYNNGNSTLAVNNSYTYDHMGRKTQTWEQISTDSTTGKPTLLSQNIYNELGQLQSKQLHSTDSVSFLQDINYAYNERGWLLQSSAPLFSEQLQYNDTSEVKRINPIAQYNGNIASQTWQSANATNNSYLYTYDRLNRLTSGITADNQFAEQGISYDMGGNIQTLARIYKGRQIDSLSYLYRKNSNQLLSVTDASPDVSQVGYQGGYGVYFYDGNGNLSIKKVPVEYNITSYNILNLPDTVTTQHGKIVYTYDATGEKLNKTTTVDSTTTSTDYISGIQYTNGKLAFIQTEEGRALPDSGTFNYEYTLADHLGNSRLNFDTEKGYPRVNQQDDYLPFGMEISGLYKDPKNEYLYNKKELQEGLGLYDYGARFYDPVIARWTTIDPLAETSRKWSPYNYVEDDPIRNTDPDGMSYQDGIYENGLYGNTVVYSASASNQEQPPKKKGKINNLNFVGADLSKAPKIDKLTHWWQRWLDAFEGGRDYNNFHYDADGNPVGPAFHKMEINVSMGPIGTLEALSKLSVEEKLANYLLNADHLVGASKAKWFEQALGYTLENSSGLAKQLVFDAGKAVETGVTQYGIKYNQVISVTGANGRVIDVMTAWIKNNDNVVRLITAFPAK